MGIRRKVAAGDTLTNAGDVWTNLFVVEKGRLSLSKESAEGRGLSIKDLERADLFWGPAFFNPDTPNPVSMRAEAETVVRIWSREVLEPLLLSNGRLSWAFARYMADHMVMASDIIHSLAFLQVGGRLAEFLMKACDADNDGPIDRTLTLEAIAAKIGSTREVVCRFLKCFADQGLIRITRTEMEMIDRAGLEAIARKEKS